MKCAHKEYDFCINCPYCVTFNKTAYYYLNRDYKFLKQDTNKYVKYPALEGALECIYFYNDDGKPWVSKKNLDQYEKCWNEFQVRADQEGLICIYD